MASKEKKGQKFGRNRDRNASSRLQKLRTEKNKRIKMEKAAARGVKMGHECPKMPSWMKPEEKQFVVFGGIVPEYRQFEKDPETGEKVITKMPHFIFADSVLKGVIIDVVR